MLIEPRGIGLGDLADNAAPRRNQNLSIAFIVELNNSCHRSMHCGRCHRLKPRRHMVSRLKTEIVDRYAELIHRLSAHPFADEP